MSHGCASLADAIAKSGLARSEQHAARIISGGAVFVNGERFRDKFALLCNGTHYIKAIGYKGGWRKIVVARTVPCIDNCHERAHIVEKQYDWVSGWDRTCRITEST